LPIPIIEKDISSFDASDNDVLKKTWINNAGRSSSIAGKFS
jgi:hypothetical protein